MRRHLLIITSMILLLGFSSAVFAEQTPQEYQLDNGLKLIVKPDHRSPVTLTMVFYKVGSAYEPGGITGVSHALEHMMFKGTEQYPAGEYTRIIAKNGGELNAMTGTDSTVYYQELAKEHLPLSFELEADRMENLTMPTDEFDSEIKVVQEEYLMRNADNPQALTYERFLASAHLQNPYHHMPIGWFNDLENMTVDDVSQWYETWYTPNNAIVVVVGDVEPDAVYQLAEQYFGDIPSKPLPTIKPQRAPESLGTRKVTVNAVAQLPYLILGYNAPSLVTTENSEDVYALTMLKYLLAGNENARFAKSLIRDQQIASFADADYTPYQKFDTLFEVDATPTPGTSIDDLKNSLLEQINHLRNTLVSEEELQFAKTQVNASQVYQQDSLFDQAMQIGVAESIDLPWQTALDFANKINAVTPEQIQSAAQKYLIPERLTIAELKPLMQDQGSQDPDDQAQGADDQQGSNLGNNDAN